MDCYVSFFYHDYSSDDKDDTVERYSGSELVVVRHFSDSKQHSISLRHPYFSTTINTEVHSRNNNDDSVHLHLFLLCEEKERVT